MSGESFSSMPTNKPTATEAVENVAGCLFDESVDLGENAGATAMQRAADADLMAVIGRKLKRARKAAGMSESVAALHLAHEGVTQISLFENGKRYPGIRNLRLLASLYGVTTDFLVDLHDDILAGPEDSNQVVLRNIVSNSLSEHFTQFVGNLAQRNAIMIEGLSVDRKLLRQTVRRVAELTEAMAVVTRQPEFEELRGGAKLARVIAEIHESMGAFVTKDRLESLALEDERQETISPAHIKQQAEQLMIQL